MRTRDLIKQHSRGWRRDRLRPFPELRFTYEEEASPEEFFVPYVWSLAAAAAAALVAQSTGETPFGGAQQQSAASTSSGRQSPSAASPSGSLLRSASGALGRCLASLEADSIGSAESDRFYWPLAVLVWGSYVMKLAARLSWAETAQNLGLSAGILSLALTSWRFQAAYRRHGAPLRLLLLTYGYLMPVLTSMEAMDAFSPAPSTIPVLGGLVDTYSLWLSTRNAFLAWALVGCRPPLYLAVPYQLFGLWRITRADFCQATVLKHPIMQQRTEVAHVVFSIGLTGMGAYLPARLVVPTSAHGRCSSLLLFYNIVFAFLAPLLLLVPLRQQQRGAAGAQPRGVLQQVERRLEGWLRQLMLPGRAEVGLGPPFPIGDLLLRWWLTVAVLWTSCCALAS
ncbi:hypothetical protein ABPG75_005879 [Micractinium tetrahymenae]